MKNKYTLIIFIIFIISNLKSTSQINIANDLYNNGEFRKAIEYFEKAEISDKKNLRKLAECYYFMNNYEGAARTYSKMERLGFLKTEDYLFYGEVLKYSQQFDTALAYFYKYQEEYPSQKVNDLIRGTGYLKRKEKNEAKYETIYQKAYNTPAANFFAQIYGNGIIFLNEESNENTGAQVEYDTTNGQSELDYGTGLRPLVKMYYYNEEEGIIPFTVTEKFHFGSFSIDTANDLIYFTRIDIAEKWNKTKKKPHINVGKIDIENKSITNIEEVTISKISNKYSIGNPAISADGNYLYFSSDYEADEYYGGFDLFVSKKQNNKWGEPKNLGKYINTAGDECLPSIIDSTLYFSTDGMVGYGNLDIFKAQMESPTKARKPEILQEPINSYADDFGYTYNKNEFFGYVSSNRFGGLGDDDIYKFKLKKLLIQGQLFDINGNPLAGATVRLYDKDGNLIAETTTDENGFYSFEVDPGEYELVVETEDGYVARRSIVADENWNNDQKIDLNLRTSVATIQGIVKDKRGRAKSGILVKLIDENGVEQGQVYTDKKGKYKFYAPPGQQYELIATTKGQAARKSLDVNDKWDNNKVIELTLRPSNTVQGTLYNEDGTISPHTEISIYDEDGNLIQKSKTDANGKYQFDLEKNKNYQIVAKKEGFEGVENIYTGDNWDNRKDLNIRMFPVTTLGTGVIKDKQTGKPLAGVKMILTDLTSNRKFVATTDENGRFDLKISKNRDYILKLEKENYYPKTIEIKANSSLGKEYDMSQAYDVDMEYAGYLVKNIYFKLGSYEITDESKLQLDKIIKVMNKKPELVIFIKSYADCRGGAAFNLKLTDKRSKSVESYLKENGIDKKRMQSKSMGATNFVNNCVRPDDCTEKEHALNRRSEFEFK